MASAATLFIDPITYADMFKQTGLPASTILREDDVAWQMWMPNTDLPKVGTANLYPAKIVNNGSAVCVHVNGHNLGALTDRCLPQAVEALSANGGQEARAYLHAGAGRTNTIYVIKPQHLRS
jgi:hypothetical protein